MKKLSCQRRNGQTLLMSYDWLQSLMRKIPQCADARVQMSNTGVVIWFPHCWCKLCTWVSGFERCLDVGTVAWSGLHRAEGSECRGWFGGDSYATAEKKNGMFWTVKSGLSHM